MVKPYTVRNLRPRRTIRLFGRTLASALGGGNSDLDLTEAETLHGSVLRLLSVGRLALVQHPPELPPALRDLLGPALEPVAVEPATDLVIEPEPEPAPAPEPLPEPLPVKVVESWEKFVPAEAGAPLDRDALMEMSFSALKKLAKTLDKSAAGSRVKIVDRILGDGE